MHINTENIPDASEVPGLSAAGGRRVYFVRHGVTEWNKLLRYQGSTDIPLLDSGREEAARLGARLHCLSGKVSKIISSPLARARETAEIIAEALGITVIETWDELTEVGFGSWEGLTVSQIIEKDGEAFFNRWRGGQLDYSPASGETCSSFFTRASVAADRILSGSEDLSIIVGHGAIFRVLFIPLLGQAKSSIFWRMRLDNCSISGVDIDKKHRASMAFLNDTLHLKVDFDDIPALPLP